MSIGYTGYIRMICELETSKTSTTNNARRYRMSCKRKVIGICKCSHWNCANYDIWLAFQTAPVEATFPGLTQRTIRRKRNEKSSSWQYFHSNFTRISTERNRTQKVAAFGVEDLQPKLHDYRTTLKAIHKDWVCRTLVKTWLMAKANYELFRRFLPHMRRVVKEKKLKLMELKYIYIYSYWIKHLRHFESTA